MRTGSGASASGTPVRVRVGSASSGVNSWSMVLSMVRLVDATPLLQRLIRFNTVNPPGDERAAQEFLGALLEDAGFEVTLVGRTEPRPNLVARLRGAQDGPTLCLLSHVDTVLATPEEWSRDPWSGDEADGLIWGRGALDMKSQTAAEVSAAIGLARSGWRPAAGDLLVVVVVDEETGGARARSGSARSIPTWCAATSCSTRAAARSSPTTTGASSASASPRRASSASA
jgi:acetylornithine deacetylase/succinyl-diaminopimelate desuccinylase-like protein